MAFIPPSAGLSSEAIEVSTQNDWTFGDIDLIGISEGSLTLLPQASADGTVGNFPPVTWTFDYDFVIYDLITDNWGLNYNSGPGWDITDAQSYPFDTNAPYAFKIETDSSATEFLNVSQESTGTLFSTTTLSLTSGFTIEIELLVESAASIGIAQPGHSLKIIDGEQSFELFFRTEGIGIRGRNEFITQDLTTYKKIRIGVQGQDLIVGFEDGTIANLPGVLNQSGIAPPKIEFGKISGNDSEAVTYVRNFKILVDSVVVDQPIDPVITYTAIAQTATSPAFSPLKAVRNFASIGIATSGASGINESTKIQTQYNNSLVSDWTSHGAYTAVLGDMTIDLTSLPTVGDGSDSIRFVFEVAGPGTGQPVKIDRLVMSTTFEEAFLRAFPNWGPNDGGNTISLELFNTQALESPLSTTPNTRLLYPLSETSGISAFNSTGGHTGTHSGSVTLGVSGPIGDETAIGGIGAVVSGETLSTTISSPIAATSNDGDVSGTIGGGFTPVLNATDSAAISYTMTTDVGPSGTSYSAQMVTAPESGEGFYADFSSPNGDHIFGFRLKVISGEIDVILSDSATSFANKTSSYSFLEYSSTREIKLITPVLSVANTSRVTFISKNGPATFQISAMTLNEFTAGEITTGTLTGLGTLDGSTVANPNDGWGIDLFVTANAFNGDSQRNDIMRLGLNSAHQEISISLDMDGFYSANIVEYPGPTQVNLTSSYPVHVGTRHNVGVAYYRRKNTTIGYLALLIDGEIVDLIRSNVNEGPYDYSLGSLVIGDLTSQKACAITVGQLHVQDSPLRPETHAQGLGLADVYFQDALQIPALLGDGQNTPRTLTLLHFNEAAGPLVDDNAYWGLPTAEVIVPRTERNKTIRGVDGIIGTAVTLNESGLDIQSSYDFNDQTQDQLTSLFFYIATMTPTTVTDIVNYVSDTNYGYSLQVDADGFLVVNVFEGSATPVRTETISGAAMGDFSWHAVAVVMNSVTGDILIYIDAYTITITGTAFRDYLTGGNFSKMLVGYGPLMTIDQFTVLKGELDPSTIDIWRIPNAIKGTPINIVYLDGEQLAADRILPIDSRSAYVVMPEHVPGEAHLSASFNDVIISAEQPYIYTTSYDRVLDMETIPLAIQRTVSPFRVLDNVPEGQVNLAYLDIRDISPSINIQTLNLSDLDPDNISNYLQGNFNLEAPISTDPAIYSGQIDTKDFNLSNRSTAWRSATFPNPLFHKYLAGRGRYYVNVPGATVTDVDQIRSTIMIVDRTGQRFGLDEFPWDCEVSNLDKNGNELPTECFSVCIFTRFAYIDGETVFASFRAADPLHEFKAIPGHREIINTVPIFTQSDLPERDNYSIGLNLGDSTYTITVRTS